MYITRALAGLDLCRPSLLQPEIFRQSAPPAQPETKLSKDLLSLAAEPLAFPFKAKVYPLTLCTYLSIYYVYAHTHMPQFKCQSEANVGECSPLLPLGLGNLTQG